MAKGKYKKKRINKLRRETSLESIQLPTKAVHILKDAGICTLYDLDLCTDEQIKALPGIGETYFVQIKELQKTLYRKLYL